MEWHGGDRRTNCAPINSGRPALHVSHLRRSERESWFGKLGSNPIGQTIKDSVGREDNHLQRNKI